MGLPALLTGLLVGAMYPLWLAAGFFDYLCHRRTGIERTSGPAESWLHLAQFVSLGIPLALAVFFQITPLVFALLAAAIVLHTLLSFVDVSYTGGKRYISPLEQHVHGFMDVLPISALGIVAVLNWNDILNSPWTVHLKETPVPSPQAALLMGSYVLLAGIPIVEELIRTSRGLRHHEVEHYGQRQERHDT